MLLSNTYHHYKGRGLSRSDQVERYVVDEIINSPLGDSDRESSRAWELMHSSTCKCFMHVLAEKRGLDHELSRVAGAVHDFYVIKTGKYKDHARRGVPMVASILNEQGDFSDREIDRILQMVGQHSEKDVYSDDPYVELTKDADVFDCSLYPGTEAYYLAKKPFPVCFEYFGRMAKVREELGLPQRVAFETLDALRAGHRVELGSVLSSQHGLKPISTFFALRSLLRVAPRNAISGIHVQHINGTTTWTCYQRDAKFEFDRPRQDGVTEAMLHSLTRFVLGHTSGSNSSLDAIETAFATCMDPLWSDLFGASWAREEAGRRLQDFECDPRADDVFESMTEQAINGLIETLAKSQHGDGAADLLLAVSGGPADETSWELDDAQTQALEGHANQVLKSRLRGSCVEVLEHQIECFRRNNPQKFDGLIPTSLLSGEVHIKEADDTPVWSLVAWPLFGSCELLVGEEALKRASEVGHYEGSMSALC